MPLAGNYCVVVVGKGGWQAGEEVVVFFISDSIIHHRKTDMSFLPLITLPCFPSHPTVMATTTAALLVLL